MTIGERMREVRKELGCKQEDISKALGISRSHLSGVENNKDQPSETFIRLFCMSYNINHEWLVTGEGDRDELPTALTDDEQEEAWNTSSGYIMKYIKLAKILYCCELDDNFTRLISDERFELLLNYTFIHMLDYLDNRDDDDLTIKQDPYFISLLPEFVFDMEEHFPGICEFYDTHIHDRVKTISHRRKHQPSMWHYADKLEKYIKEESCDIYLGNYIQAEEELHKSRIFPIVSDDE